MADLADLHNSTVSTTDPELHEAVVLDDATERGQEIRCVIPSFGEGYASDPMAWEPYTTATGEFWPKRGDRVVVTAHADGPPVIVWWEPVGERDPDSVTGGDALGVIVHGEDPNVARGTSHSHYVWIGTVRPNFADDLDLLAKYA